MLSSYPTYPLYMQKNIQLITRISPVFLKISSPNNNNNLYIYY